MKPVLFYVDDEPHNLTVFEASVPEDWQVYTFDNPLAAMAALEDKKPWIIVSDQRMPGMPGVQFLEMTRKFLPHSVRIIVTGYSDENLVVESVRKAAVFDYIRKPWDPTDLEQSLKTALEFFKKSEESRILTEELQRREIILKEQAASLTRLTHELEQSKKIEQNMRRELECWVPPFVLWAVQDDKIRFPIKRNLVGVAFDIVNSSAIHDKYVQGKSLRSVIIQTFSETIIKHGGWRESHSGDSAYGHFGLVDQSENPADAALAVAREFRVALRSLCTVYDVVVERGIAVHLSKDSVVDVHTVQLNTPRGVITQKSFDTTSTDIDLLHRMEKLSHSLPGSNIIISAPTYEILKSKPANAIFIGDHWFTGQKNHTGVYVIPSDQTKEAHIQTLLSQSVGFQKAS